jgi:hypothetical protein
MQKFSLLVLVVASVFLLVQCSSTRKTAATTPALTYENGVAAVMLENCSPCHYPSQGGKKKAYDNFSSVKTDIDEIIRRVELSPGEKGFMPFKKTSRLSDSVIQVLKTWRSGGLSEK